MEYKHLFGPVPSRRLGMSLGVDLVPHKVCTLNCIYCECGPTTNLTMDRKEYVPVKEVAEELRHFFSHNPDPDYITFSGAGEPTLNINMGEVLAFLKDIRPEVPAAVLTNGTLFSDAAVRNELMLADLVLPSLDAATSDALRKINRPRKELDVEGYIGGLVEFRKEFHGKIWLEVFILPGYNDDHQNIESLREAIKAIAPDKVQLNTLDRPGVIGRLRPATNEELETLAGIWNLKDVEIVVPATVRHRSTAYRSDTENAILETITRRPCTLNDIQQILGIHVNVINKYLSALKESGHVETVRQERGIFYQIRKS